MPHYLETGAQGVSYTTGVPAMIGAKLFIQGSLEKTRGLERRRVQIPIHS